MSLIIVGIADMKISDNPEDVLVTYSLGSCLGIAIYDPVVKVAGLLHIMLPDSSIETNKDSLNPYKYVDTGVPRLFKESYKYGAIKSRIKVKVAGGANIMDKSGFFNIGKRNYIALRKLLWKNNVLIENEDIGGIENRTIKIEVATGRVIVEIGRKYIKEL